MSEFYIYPEDEEYKEYFEPPNYLQKLEKLEKLDYNDYSDYSDYSKYLENNTMNITLDEPYFNYIKSGEKIYDIRIMDNTNNTIKLLDTIIFNTLNSKELLKARILEISHFNTLKDAINDPHLYINDLTPDIDNIDDAIDIYNDILSYENNINNINNNGLIRYKFELI